jgi:hypothetical protein
MMGSELAPAASVTNCEKLVLSCSVRSNVAEAALSLVMLNVTVSPGKAP